jgi:hypothetical protein
MQLLDEIKKIIKKYELNPKLIPEEYPDVYLYIRINPEVENMFKSLKNDSYFINKYEKHIGKGHYGFSIGQPIIPSWNEVLDEIIELCIKKDPNFIIKQIKMKFGFICFYTESDVISDLNEIEALITNTLFNIKFKY